MGPPADASDFYSFFFTTEYVMLITHLKGITSHRVSKFRLAIRFTHAIIIYKGLTVQADMKNNSKFACYLRMQR